MANGLQRIIFRGAECIFVGSTMLPQEAGSPPTARGARIVFFVSIVALGILSLLMIEAWGLDPEVSCPGAFPPSTSCSARPLWFGLAVIWAAAAAGIVALWIGQARRRHIGYGMRMPPLATLAISIFLLGLGAFVLWAGNEPSDSRESDARGGPDNRSGGHLRRRTGRGGPGGLVAPRRALLRPPRFGPRRDGRIQAQSDFRVRERDRDFASSLAEDPGPTPILSMVRDPRRLSTQL